MRSVDACENGEWHLAIWRKADPSRVKRIPYSCRSWRHLGPCADWRGALDFARVQHATRSRSDWSYIVLTYPSNDWPDLMALYRATVIHWARLRKRFARKWGKTCYIQTWEAHRSGYPHVNILLGNPGLHAACLEGWRAVRREWLEPAAVECGFGPRTWLEPMKDADAMAGYLCKLSRELVGHGHKGQTPLVAPPHFRRLRASRGVLPPPFKDPDITGQLIKAPIGSETYITIDSAGGEVVA